MMRRLAVAAAALAAAALPGAALAAGAVDHATEQLMIECALRVGEKIPKIAGLSLQSSHQERHGDLLEGSFLVKAFHFNVYFDAQCRIGNVSTTDLTGKTTSREGISDVWINLRVP